MAINVIKKSDQMTIKKIEFKVVCETLADEATFLNAIQRLP